jgi:hypothetical protein
MPVPPRKPIDEMTEEEIRRWEEWLLAEGMNPVPIRQDAPPTSPSYAWDPGLGATLEYAHGKRYFVGIRDGKIARLAPVDTPAEIPASHTVSPDLPDTRKRKLA